MSETKSQNEKCNEPVLPSREETKRFTEKARSNIICRHASDKLLMFGSGFVIGVAVCGLLYVLFRDNEPATQEITQPEFNSVWRGK